MLIPPALVQGQSILLPPWNTQIVGQKMWGVEERGETERGPSEQKQR